MLAIVLGLSSCGTHRNDENNKRFQVAISSIRASSDPDFQEVKARALYRSIKGHTCREIDERTLRELISLLDIWHDGVRLQAVKVLRRIGPCAKLAIPKLKEILVQADCWPSGMRSGGYIHETLTQLGEPPIPDAICTGPAEGYIPITKS